jgi:hypothetical protein
VFTPPLSLTFVIISDVILGILVGTLTGLFASLLLRLTIRLWHLFVDGILGAVAFPLAFQAVLLIPWRNTITYHVGDILVTSTSDTFQYPYSVAYAAAIFLPILHELRRFRNRTRPTG